MRRWLRRDGGQAVVEFALVLPLIAIFLLGMMQIGLALNTRQQLEGVARQGARTFALTGDPRATVEAVRLAGRQLAAFDARAGMANTVSGPNGEQRASGGGRSLGLALPARVQRGDWMTITVTYQYPNPIQASVFGFRLPATFPLSTSASARVEYDASPEPP